MSDLTNIFNIFNLVPRVLSYSSPGVGEDPGNEVDLYSGIPKDRAHKLHGYMENHNNKNSK